MSRAPDDFDGITSAFLGGGSSGYGTSKSRAVAQTSLMPTLLIVGNVPTLAGIWIAQYADQHARTSGPVALIRLDGAASRGEVYRAQGRALPTDGGAWMERASIFARSWIVCTDCQTDASAIALSGCSLVLLSGTDETALAAAKRQLKQLCKLEKWGRRAVRNCTRICWIPRNISASCMQFFDRMGSGTNDLCSFVAWRTFSSSRSSRVIWSCSACDVELARCRCCSGIYWNSNEWKSRSIFGS